MCGIVGVFNPGARSERVSAEILERMTDEIFHRGPDDSGVHISEDRTLGLGFRRLSILDLSYAGHQPMANNDESIWLTFNGEIYNHRELRADLEARGYCYRSNTDTESILYAYQEYGPEFVQKLIGMFAIAIWDTRQKQVHLYRDRLGVKPLYLYEKDGTFYWSSEIKALLQHPEVDRELNVQGLGDYLSFYITPPTESLFRNIHKLEAGHTLTIDAEGKSSKTRYWDVDNATFSYDPSDLNREDFCVDRIRELLRESISMRMIADVPFGVLLSGGVDSSLNVALMSELMDRPVETFSAGFKDLEQHNELGYARKIAEKFATNHHETLIGEADVVSHISDMVYHQDEPNADPACVPMYFVSRAARESGTIVVQVGEGADELFSGYSHYLSELKYHRYYYNLPRVVHHLLAPILRVLSSNTTIHDYADRARSRSTPVFYGAIPAFSQAAKERVLQGQLFRGLESAERVSRRYLQQFDRLWGDRTSTHLDRLTYFDMKVRLAELLLMRVDKMAMAHSIEPRVPFLDHRLVEFAYLVPDELKVKGKIGKYVLKKAAEGIIPDEIIYRRKQGLNSPIVEWLRTGKLAAHARELILDSELMQPKAGIFERAEVERLLHLHQSGRSNQSKSIWALMVLSLWHSRFFD